MKNIKKVFCMILVLAMVFAMSACGNSGNAAQTSADEWEGTTIKIATNENDAAFLAELGAAIGEATGGKITCETIDRSSIGSGTDVLAMITSGSLEMTQLSTSDCEKGTFPICDLAEIPFFSPSPTATTEMFYSLYEGGYLDKEFENVHLLFMWATDGQRMAFVDAKPQSAADFSGLKFRCQSAGGTTMLGELGASGTKISSSETYMSLERKVVDGSISSPTAMVKLSYDEVCGYLMDNVLYSGISLVLCSNEFWNSIPAEYQVILNDVCQEFRYKYLSNNYNNEAAAIEHLSENGMEVFTASDELMASIHDASQGLLDEYKANISGLGYDAEEIVGVAKAAVERVDYHFE